MWVSSPKHLSAWLTGSLVLFVAMVDSFSLLLSLQYFPLNLPTFYPNFHPLIFVFKAVLSFTSIGIFLSHSSHSFHSNKMRYSSLDLHISLWFSWKRSCCWQIFSSELLRWGFQQQLLKKKKKKTFRRGTEHLPSMQEALGLISSTA